jgi:hypothetical protein
MFLEANENRYVNGLASVKFNNLPEHPAVPSPINFFQQFYGFSRWRAENMEKYAHYDGPWQLTTLSTGTMKAKMHTFDPNHPVN